MLSAGRIITLQPLIAPAIASSAAVQTAAAAQVDPEASTYSDASAQTDVAKAKPREMAPMFRLASMASGKDKRPWIGRKEDDVKSTGNPKGAFGKGGGDDGSDNDIDARVRELIAEFSQAPRTDGRDVEAAMEFSAMAKGLKPNTLYLGLGILTEKMAERGSGDDMELLRWASVTAARSLPNWQRNEYKRALVKLLSDPQMFSLKYVTAWKSLMETRFKDLAGRNPKKDIDLGLRLIEDRVKAPETHLPESAPLLHTAMALYRGFLPFDHDISGFGPARRLAEITEYARKLGPETSERMAPLQHAIIEELSGTGYKQLITNVARKTMELGTMGDHTEPEALAEVCNKIRKYAYELSCASRPGLVIFMASELRGIIYRSKNVLTDVRGQILSDTYIEVTAWLQMEDRDMEMRSLHSFTNDGNTNKETWRFASHLLNRLWGISGPLTEGG